MKKKIISIVLSVVMVCSSLTYFSAVSAGATAPEIEAALQWAIAIANDDTHGYSQTSRWGPDYDCSSLVVSALKAAGIPVGSASNTGDMISQLTANGFTWIPWNQIGSESNLQRGDILLKKKPNGHSEFYLGNGLNVGAHEDKDNVTGDSSGKEVSVSDYYYHPWDGVLRYDYNSTIQGNFEDYAGGNGTVYVKGWAFDSVNTSVSTEVHVYIGGPAGEGEGHIIKANVYRSDVDDAKGCGDYHGFESTITTKKRGTQPIYVYAIGVDTNTNISLGSATVTISDVPSDTSKPVVSNVKIAKTDAKSFTVSCTVKDNALSKVHMYAWYTSDKDGTQKCYNATISGTTATYTIPIADLGGKNGNYTVHIYAYDTKENCGTGAITLDFYNPLGTLDSYSGGGGSVTLRGWAFDGNDTSKPVEMNVYIGGDAGVGEGHAFLANTSRPDVDDVHGCGDNHGFSVTLSTKKTGTQDVYVYMQNIGYGGVKLLKKVTVTISRDSQKASVKDTKVSSFDGTTFTVTANVSDNSKVEKASFAVWLDGDKDNTLKWLTGTVSNGVASCKIKRSDISNKQGKFIVHVYVYDSAGNYDVGKTEYKYYTPTGSVEVIEGAENSIKIIGWVYDENNFNESVQLQVTIGSGSNKENYTITADKLREDINKQYNCGAYHGFEATLDTKYVGSTYVVVGAKDIDTGVATTLKIATVNVTDAPKVIIGNVNNDESLDVNDVTYFQMFLAGYINSDGSVMIETSKAEVFKNADANGDGSLDVNDVTHIQMVIAGVIK